MIDNNGNDLSLRVAIENASPEFSGPTSPLLRLTAAATPRPVVYEARPTRAHIVYHSNVTTDLQRAIAGFQRFTQRRMPRANAFVGRAGAPDIGRYGSAVSHIWYTGENVSPPLGYDATLSFETDPYAGQNAYLPYWYFHVGGAFSSRLTFSGRRPSVPELMAGRVMDTASRPRFMCAFINNPTPIRLRAIDTFRQFGQVDVFGSHSGRPISQKYEIARDYRFMLAFENDLYPGYVTEKAIDAWTCGCVPLWWGNDSMGYLNAGALLNLAETSSLDEFVTIVRDIERKASHNEISRQPLLTKPPGWSSVLDAVRGAIPA